MKKKHILLSLVFTIGAFLGCKKIDQDPDYHFTIVVKTVDDSTLVQNALVEVGVPSSVDSDLQFWGYTDVRGEISFEYDKDAVFRVRATRGENPYSYIGCTYVRLEPNQHVVKTVYLVPYDPTIPGCTLNF